MAITATRIADVIYNATRRHFEAVQAAERQILRP